MRNYLPGALLLKKLKYFEVMLNIFEFVIAFIITLFTMYLRNIVE